MLTLFSLFSIPFPDYSFIISSFFLGQDVLEKRGLVSFPVYRNTFYCSMFFLSWGENAIIFGDISFSLLVIISVPFPDNLYINPLFAPLSPRVEGGCTQRPVTLLSVRPSLPFSFYQCNFSNFLTYFSFRRDVVILSRPFRWLLVLSFPLFI